MDILNLVEVIIHKFETVAIGQFDAVKLADAETVDRHVHFGAGGSASTSTKTKPSTSAKWKLLQLKRYIIPPYHTVFYASKMIFLFR